MKHKSSPLLTITVITVRNPCKLYGQWKTSGRNYKSFQTRSRQIFKHFSVQFSLKITHNSISSNIIITSIISSTIKDINSISVYQKKKKFYSTLHNIVYSSKNPCSLRKVQTGNFVQFSFVKIQNPIPQSPHVKKN